MVFQRKNIFFFALTLLSVGSIAKFVSAFTRVLITLFTKYNIRRRTHSLLQSKGFMVADEIRCAGKLAELTTETNHKGDVKCKDFCFVSDVNHWS
jgi:Zn-dependent membrane protease YugP